MQDPNLDDIYGPGYANPNEFCPQVYLKPTRNAGIAANDN